MRNRDCHATDALELQMNAQQKKTSRCASNLLAHEDLGQFEEAHIQAKFYNENSH